VDPNRKVPDLYFKVVDPKLQVADLKAEVREMRSPNLTPVWALKSYCYIKIMITSNGLKLLYSKLTCCVEFD